MRFDPHTLAMIACRGWSEDDILRTQELLSRETAVAGGHAGRYWWSFPPS
jgi:hypothetical protein